MLIVEETLSEPMDDDNDTDVENVALVVKVNVSDIEVLCDEENVEDIELESERVSVLENRFRVSVGGFDFVVVPSE